MTSETTISWRHLLGCIGYIRIYHEVSEIDMYPLDPFGILT